MDSRPMSYSDPLLRSTSRIHQDLADFRFSKKAQSNQLMQKSMMETSQKSCLRRSSKLPRVCVVGAGTSGLRCADILLQRGFQVTILEARDRIGGRIHHTTLPSGHILDLGPNWVHGTEDNPILELANEEKVALHSWEEQSHVFSDNGSILEDGSTASNLMWGIISSAFKYSAQNTADIDPNTSLHDFFVDKVKEIDNEQQRRIVMQMAEGWGGYVGSPVTRQTLKFFWLEECINGNNLFCAGNLQKILARIAQPALRLADLRLSTKVTSISTNSNIIKVAIEGGSEMDFDEVVMTAPLGWLKQHRDDAFTPALTPDIIKAIDCIGYGSLEKVFVTFPRAFWSQQGTSVNQDTSKGFIQWLSPSYASETNPSRWYEECVDLSTLPHPHAHPTLLFYIFGDQSVALSKGIASRQTEKERQDYLMGCFKPYFSLLPDYVEDSDDCKPTTCTATNWLADDLAGNGSYSSFRTGLVQADKDIEILREGLPDRGLWFAGEHIGPFIALGTVTGAYWSGESVGNRIATAYGLDVPSEAAAMGNEAQLGTAARA